MNGGKEDCRRYNVLSTKYQVLSTKYQVPGTKIPQKYDLGQNTNPLIVQGTKYNVPSILSALYNEIRMAHEFPLLHSTLGVRH